MRGHPVLKVAPRAAEGALLLLGNSEESQSPLGFLVGTRSPLLGLLTVANTSELNDVIFPEGIERVAVIGARHERDSGLRLVVVEEGTLKGVGCEVVVEEVALSEMVGLRAQCGVGTDGLGGIAKADAVMIGGRRVERIGKGVTLLEALKGWGEVGQITQIRFLTTGEEKQRGRRVPMVRLVEKEKVERLRTVDVLFFVPSSLPLAEVQTMFLSGAARQYGTGRQGMRPFHFRPDSWPFFVTLLLDAGKPDMSAGAVEKRREIHRALMLPEMPIFLKSMALPSVPHFVRACKNGKSTVLTNVHKGIRPHNIPGARMSMVRGTYNYYHYRQDGFNDCGWGCAYRSLQTLVSWCLRQGYAETSLKQTKSVPSHKLVQEILFKLGDKPKSFMGSKEWIGANEVCYVLEHLTGVSSRILHVARGSEVENRRRELARHFDTYGSPVMVGGGVLAWTILGIAFNEDTGRAKFLILDPHYEGPENVSIIQKKGWVGWKDASIFKGNAFYNMCLPLVPKVV